VETVVPFVGMAETGIQASSNSSQMSGGAGRTGYVSVTPFQTAQQSTTAGRMGIDAGRRGE
jgi:hypothetical protein